MRRDTKKNEKGKDTVTGFGEEQRGKQRAPWFHHHSRTREYQIYQVPVSKKAGSWFESGVKSRIPQFNHVEKEPRSLF
jgi:hypothetical protein